MPEEDIEYVAVPIGKIEREEVKEKDGEKENISEIGMTEIEEKDADTTDMDLTDINFDEDVEEENLESKMSVECLESGWETVSKTKDNSSDEPPVLDMQVDASQLPLITNENGDQVLRFYWLDAYEDFFHQKGIVYLFGKVWFESVKSFASCCVSVKNIERRIRVLPRAARLNPKTKIEDGPPVKLADVYEEFSEKVADKYKITTFKSRKVTCKYAFELEGIPAESDYLEVRYSYDMQMLPNDLHGETFSHIFGTNTSGLEILLLDRQMKGPCWLDLKNPQVPNPPFSWSKVEATIKNLVDLTVVKESLPIPPLVVMTLNLRTLPNPKTHQNEVIAAAYLVNNAFAIDKPPPTKKIFHQDWCAISKPTDCIFPFDFKDKLQKNKNMKVEISPTERALLGFLLAKIHKVDPDVIVGHDIYGFDIDILLNRITANKIPHWSKIGRLKRSTVPKLSGGRGSSAEKAAACGRLICDVKISAHELVHLKSYELSELTQQILKGKQINVDQDHIRDMYNSSANLMKLIEFTLMDCSYILRIMYELNVLPLALQITSICGNVMSRTLMGGRSERNEYLLLHAFTEKDYIVPDKQFKKKPVPMTEFDEDGDPISDKKSSGRKKPAYAGGLVLEPKKGFYDKYILLLDFNSLYPSIIQEYNICFTTVVQQHSPKNDNNNDDDFHVELPESGLEPGILPTEIRKLVESRRQVKTLMKQKNLSHELKMQYDIRQKALKLTANSMYGCLGFTFSRFFAKPLAALVTERGREILMQTKTIVEGMNLEVIYGDTDSIMVNTNCTDYKEVYKLGKDIKTDINKRYRLLEIDIDGIYKSMLLLKKKKYAAIKITKDGDGKIIEEQELKGLDIVRRDWCDLAKNAGNFVVQQILSGQSRESILENIHLKLSEVGEKVCKNELPVDLYLITKQLTKDPEDYPNKKSLPHVQVAMRINSKGGKKMKAGDTVPYLICKDGSNLGHSQRAYHPDELAKNGDLSIDSHYYLAQQIHPVVMRLCDPIEGTDAAILAECLGLDPTSYRRSLQQNEDHGDDALLGFKLSSEERFKECEKFKVKCPSPSCGTDVVFDCSNDWSLDRCANQSCSLAPKTYIDKILNQLVITMRKHIKKYYQGWMQCDDPICATEVRKMPLIFHRGHPVCPVCHKGILHSKYTDSTLYNQLCFYKSTFNKDRPTVSHEHKPLLKSLTDTVQAQLAKSEYSVVNLSKLFADTFVLTS